MILPFYWTIYYNFFPYNLGTFEKRVFPHALTEAIDWFNQNTNEEDIINFDFLNWWEQPFLLYTAVNPGNHLLSFASTIGPSGKTALPDSLLNSGPVNSKMFKTAKCHLHLKDYHPKYLVMASDVFYTETIEKALFNASYRRRSDFRDYMLKSDYQLVLNSPFLTDLRLNLDKVFENKMISIYKISYLDK